MQKCAFTQKSAVTYYEMIQSNVWLPNSVSGLSFHRCFDSGFRKVIQHVEKPFPIIPKGYAFEDPVQPGVTLEMKHMSIKAVISIRAPTYLASKMHHHEPSRCSALAQLPPCISLMPLQTFNDIPLQNRYQLSGTIFLLLSVILPAWTLSNLLSKQFL